MNGPLNIYTNGNLNIISRKINFKEISMNENYKASNEDLKYIKKNLKIFVKMIKLRNFKFKKIKEFILEIS